MKAPKSPRYRAWSCTPEHTAFAVVETSDATKLHQFFRPQGLKGKVEFTPVGNHIANRKANGDWGKNTSANSLGWAVINW